MPFLPRNQQRQSTDGISAGIGMEQHYATVTLCIKLGGGGGGGGVHVVGRSNSS